MKRYRRNWRQTCDECGHYDESFWSYLKMRFIGEPRRERSPYATTAEQNAALTAYILGEIRPHNVMGWLLKKEE